MDAFLKGKQFLLEGDFEGAIVQLEFSLLNDRYHWETYYYLAKTYLKQATTLNDPEFFFKSLHTLQSLESLNPKYDLEKSQSLKETIFQASLLLGIKVVDNDVLDEATLALDPYETIAHSRISRSRKEGPGTRIIRYKDILLADPANILALSHLAKAYEDTNNAKVAKNVYEELLKHALGIEVSTGLYHSEEHLSGSIRAWVDEIIPSSKLGRESLEIVQIFCRLAQILVQMDQSHKASLMFGGAIDLAIHLDSLSSITNVFNDFLSSCIQSENFILAKVRLPFLRKVLSKSEEQKDLLDPLLVSLIKSRTK